MASRYASHHTQREGRPSLFTNYDGRPASHSPDGRPGSSRSRYGDANQSTGAFAAYPNGGPSATNQFRAATPNSRGQYSDAVLSELESQNDEQVSGILGKVAMLKGMTIAIGDEIRDSSALAEKMNDSFSNTSLRLRGTMTRMMRMAESTGVGWRVWLGFFAAVILLFWYVWLF